MSVLVTISGDAAQRLLARPTSHDARCSHCDARRTGAGRAARVMGSALIHLAALIGAVLAMLLIAGVGDGQIAVGTLVRLALGVVAAAALALIGGVVAVGGPGTVRRCDACGGVRVRPAASRTAGSLRLAPARNRTLSVPGATMAA